MNFEDKDQRIAELETLSEVHNKHAAVVKKNSDDIQNLQLKVSSLSPQPKGYSR